MIAQEYVARGVTKVFTHFARKNVFGLGSVDMNVGHHVHTTVPRAVTPVQIGVSIARVRSCVERLVFLVKSLVRGLVRTTDVTNDATGMKYAIG